MNKIMAWMMVSVLITGQSAQAEYLVKEFGSFHIGGRSAALNGLPTREIVFSPSAPAVKLLVQDNSDQIATLIEHWLEGEAPFHGRN